jgi:hypothetical protein
MRHERGTVLIDPKSRYRHPLGSIPEINASEDRIPGRSYA